MGNFRKILAVVLLGVFVSAKVSSLHAFAHEDVDADQIENCSWCHLALTNQLSDAHFEESRSMEVHANALIGTREIFYAPPSFASLTFRSNLFSRPPPAVS